MKRDMELIRKILLELEKSPNGYVDPNIQIEGYSYEEVNYHCFLLVDSGLVEGEFCKNLQASTPAAYIKSLNWKGHEFLDLARNESLWKEAIGKVAKLGGSVTLPVLIQILSGLAKNSLGI